MTTNDRSIRADVDAIPEASDTIKHHCLTAFQRKLLGKALEEDLPAKYRQRIAIMMLADEGKTQAQICKALACSPSTARYWISRARSGMAHAWQENAIGRPKVVTEAYLERLQELVSQHPKSCGYPFDRWSARWLSKHLAKEFGIVLTDRHINRLLKGQGLATNARQPTSRDIDHKAWGIEIRHLPCTETQTPPEAVGSRTAPSNRPSVHTSWMPCGWTPVKL